MFLIKAKKFIQGTIRKRKAGLFIKDGPKHWSALKEIVKEHHSRDGRDPREKEVKLMQQAAVKIIRETSKSRDGYSKQLAMAILKRDYGHHGLYALWYKRVLQAVEKYVSDQKSVKVGSEPKSEAMKKYAQWKESSKDAFSEMHTDVERDEWVSRQFTAKKKPVAHILWACREMIGRDAHLSMVPNSGFKGYLKSMIEKIYEHGPSGLSMDEIRGWTKNIHKALDNSAALIPLEKAISQSYNNPLFKKDPKWFLYCCRRYALKNEGYVDLAHIPKYMENAKKFHGSKNPPAVDYDERDHSLISMVRSGMMRPTSAMDKMNVKTSKREEMKKIFMRKKKLKKAMYA